MSDITNNEEITEVVEESPVVEAVVVDAAENPVVQTPVVEAPAVETPVVTAPATPVVEAPERKGPVIQTPVVKGTKAAVVESDGSRPNPRKVREGIVVSDKMDMTLVVAVNERVSHPRYGKTVQRTKKLYVHDENNDAKVGDRVRVQETRPVSKLKRWRLTEVVERAR
jgi:small subunit ribosomal protein S17